MEPSKVPLGGFRGLQRKILLRVRRIEVAIFFLMLKRGSCFPHSPPFIFKLQNPSHKYDGKACQPQAGIVF